MWVPLKHYLDTLWDEGAPRAMFDDLFVELQIAIDELKSDYNFSLDAEEAAATPAADDEDDDRPRLPRRSTASPNEKGEPRRTVPAAGSKHGET
jgi:hypothetical protein